VRPRPSGQSTVKVQSDGIDRDYLLFVPRSYTGATAVPVVFDFHGFASTAAQQIAYGDYRPQADRSGALVVAPDGQGQGVGRHWNITRSSTEADDVAFTLGILDRLEADFCVDHRRVFSTGMSAGGAMTVLLACAASDRFAAFGPVAVVFYSPLCDGARSVPIAAFMGTADPIVPFNGGKVNCCGASVVPPAPTSMAGWAAHDHCREPEERKLSPMVTLRQWPGCNPPGDVRFYIVEGGGHTWPGAAVDATFLGMTTKEINASETLWEFFQAHPMPA
jgi:polyhydroxybutyrate depolymerase